MDLIRENETSWELYLTNIKSQYEDQFITMQREINKLYDLVAEWVLKYMVIGRQIGLDYCKNVISLFDALKESK
jgi:hypothetical protein